MNQKTVRIILIIIGVVIVGVATYCIFFTKSPEIVPQAILPPPAPQTGPPIITFLPSTLKTISVPLSATVSFNTHTSNSYGLVFKYPKVLDRVSTGDDCFENCVAGFSSNTISSHDFLSLVLVYEATYAQTKEELISRSSFGVDEINVQEESIVLNGVLWVKLTSYPIEGDPLIGAYFIENQGKTYMVYIDFKLGESYATEEEYMEKLVHPILSSFTFN